NARQVNDSSISHLREGRKVGTSFHIGKFFFLTLQFASLICGIVASKQRTQDATLSLVYMLPSAASAPDEERIYNMTKISPIMSKSRTIICFLGSLALAAGAGFDAT